ncbi:MAG: SDR family NAD(P)-dependent oxidoreductase [Sphingomicrobium sp.]
MKTAFITGVTAGIGEACARTFVADGWRVIGTGRRVERLAKLAEELGEAFTPIALDMRDKDKVIATAEGLPPVDLLVNNAGYATAALPLNDADLEPILGMIETNVIGLVVLTKTMLPNLIATKGAIIDLSSVAATYPYRGGCNYAGTKAYVHQFTLGLRCDLQGTGVRVTSIEPGMVETEFTVVRNGGDQAASDAFYGGVEPMTAQDIANTIHWVATLPPHLNVNTLELMPVNQSWAGFAIHREG